MSNETLFSSQRDELQKCECHLQSKGGTRNSAICRYSFVRYERYSLTATIKKDNTVGVELNFNKEFYVPEEIGSVDEILEELKALDKELEEIGI